MTCEVKEIKQINLTETPEFVDWPELHYVFVEQGGPFFESAPACWGTLHKNLPALLGREDVKVERYFSAYTVDPFLYRAGVSIAEKVEGLPEAYTCTRLPGGKYAKFVLTGPYSNLPQACGRVEQLVKELSLDVRAGYNIEHYTKDPRTTPEDELVTELLVPVN